MENFLHRREQYAHHKTERERRRNFKKRFYHNGQDIYNSACKRFRDSEGYRKDHKAHSVVKRNDGKQKIRNGALRLVLVDDHHGSGGRGSRGDRAERYRRRKRYLVGESKMQRYERGVDRKSGCKRLKYTDDGSLLARFFQRRKAEFVAYGKGYKARRRLCYNVKTLERLGVVKAYAGDLQRAYKIGPHDNTGYDIRRDRGQPALFRQSGHHKSRQKNYGNS